MSKNTVLLQNRPCGPLKSSRNPDAYDKAELVSLAQSLLNYTKTEATKLTKTQLCEQLIASEMSTTKATKTSKTSKTSKTQTSKTSKTSKSKKPVALKKATKTKAYVDIQVAPSLTKSKTIRRKPKGDCIVRSNIKLQSHQAFIVNYLKTHRGVILAWEPGTGKTLAAVAASQCYLDEHIDGIIIVVTPVSLRANFKKEMAGYGLDEDDDRYVFYTYQSFATYYKKRDCPANAMLIIDEAHNLRTDIAKAKVAGRARTIKAQEKDTLVGRPPKARENTVIAEVAIRCAKNVDKVLLLTGTSVYNNPRDIVNLVSMVTREEVPRKKEFDSIVKDPYRFRKYVECIFSFFEISLNSEDYPTVLYEWRPITMDRVYYKEYRKVEQAKSSLFITTNPWAYLGGVRQASNALDQCPKCEWVLKKVKEGDKTLIYSAFLTFGVDRIKKLLKDNQIPFVEVTGQQTDIAREKAVKTYNKGDVNVILLTKAGAEGLDLKKTKNVIIFESTWNEATEEQVIRRAARYKSHEGLPKKDRVVHVYRLIMVKPQRRELGDTRDSADTILKKIMQSKIEENTAFLNKLKPYSIERWAGCNKK